MESKSTSPQGAGGSAGTIIACCPKCRESAKVPAKAIGRRVECNRCKTQFVIQSMSATEPVAEHQSATLASVLASIPPAPADLAAKRPVPRPTSLAPESPPSTEVRPRIELFADKPEMPVEPPPNVSSNAPAKNNTKLIAVIAGTALVALVVSLYFAFRTPTTPAEVATASGSPASQAPHPQTAGSDPLAGKSVVPTAVRKIEVTNPVPKSDDGKKDAAEDPDVKRVKDYHGKLRGTWGSIPRPDDGGCEFLAFDGKGKVTESSYGVNPKPDGSFTLFVGGPNREGLVDYEISSAVPPVLVITQQDSKGQLLQERYTIVEADEKKLRLRNGNSGFNEGRIIDYAKLSDNPHHFTEKNSPKPTPAVGTPASQSGGPRRNGDGRRSG